MLPDAVVFVELTALDHEPFVASESAVATIFPYLAAKPHTRRSPICNPVDGIDKLRL